MDRRFRSSRGEDVLLKSAGAAGGTHDTPPPSASHHGQPKGADTPARLTARDSSMDSAGDAGSARRYVSPQHTQVGGTISVEADKSRSTSLAVAGESHVPQLNLPTVTVMPGSVSARPLRHGEVPNLSDAAAPAPASAARHPSQRSIQSESHAEKGTPVLAAAWGSTSAAGSGWQLKPRARSARGVSAAESASKVLDDAG